MTDFSSDLALATSDDAFLGGRLRILQPLEGHRAGLDAVFLAAAVPVSGGDSADVLDAGSGSGIVALAVAARAGAVRVRGVEIVPELVSIANLNAERNQMAGRVRFLEGDLTAPLATLKEVGLAPNTFDHVVANPPFEVIGRSRTSTMALRNRASAMAAGDLDRWARFLAAMARPGGSVTLVHRADALGEVLAVLGGRFGGLAVLPLHPRSGEPAHRVIVQGRKASRAPMRLLPGMVLHEKDGTFCAGATKILRDGAPLEISNP